MLSTTIPSIRRPRQIHIQSRMLKLLAYIDRTNPIETRVQRNSKQENSHNCICYINIRCCDVVHFYYDHTASSVSQLPVHSACPDAFTPKHETCPLCPFNSWNVPSMLTVSHAMQKLSS